MSYLQRCWQYRSGNVTTVFHYEPGETVQFILFLLTFHPFCWLRYCHAGLSQCRPNANEILIYCNLQHRRQRSAKLANEAKSASNLPGHTYSCCSSPPTDRTWTGPNSPGQLPANLTHYGNTENYCLFALSVINVLLNQLIAKPSAQWRFVAPCLTLLCSANTCVLLGVPTSFWKPT